MLEAFRIRFSRRRNGDGTFDSMCTQCFATVARSKREADLEEVEDAHFCRPGRLREFQPGGGQLP
jgi:hypothetical protein